MSVEHIRYSSMVSVPICELPADMMLQVLEKADLSSLCRIRKASATMDNMAEHHRSSLARQRKDNFHVTLKISNTTFTLSVKGKVLSKPMDQLSGMNISKIDIAEMDNVVQPLVVKNVFRTLSAMHTNKKADTIIWRKFPLCGILKHAKGAEVNFKFGTVSEVLGKVIEELSSIPQFLPPDFKLEGFGSVGSLPSTFHRIWAYTNLPDYYIFFALPRAVYVNNLPSDCILIVFEYIEKRYRSNSPTAFGEYQIVKATVTQKTPYDVRKTVERFISSHSGCARVFEEINKGIIDCLEK